MGTESGWAGLVRAYGLAEDVPGLLGAMGSADEGVRTEALAWLNSLLCYREGARTSPAVPELVRLAVDGPGHRAGLLGLLTSLANFSGPDDEQERVKRLLIEALPALLPLTRDTDPDIRGAAVPLITTCFHEAGRPAPAALRERLAEESDPVVRGRIVTALGLLEDGDGDWRHALLDDPEPRVALAAAEDLLRTAHIPLPTELVDRGARAWTADPQEPEGYLWPPPHRTFADRLLEDPEAALRAAAGGVSLAFAITSVWRDREADVLPWALRETEGEEGAWRLYRLAQLTCALPPELHGDVRERVLPYLAHDDPATRAAAIVALVRTGVPSAAVVEETVRLLAEAPGAYDTSRAVSVVVEAYGAQALPVGRALAGAGAGSGEMGGRLGEGHCESVKVLVRFPEVAVGCVEELTGLLTRHGTGYPTAAVRVLAALGPAAGDVGERALRRCVAEGVHLSVSAEAAVALWPVAADPEPALSFLRREMSAGPNSWAANLAAGLGAAAAPLLPLIEPLLAPTQPAGSRATAARAVWRIAGRTEDTVEPLARKALAWQRMYPGTTHPVKTLTEMGLLPRFAVGPLRQGADAPRRAFQDLMCGHGPHPDYVLRAAVRELLATARVVG
ncbi:hypothetical protein ABZ330_29145 [Streptomyces sp. NPDC006172]|uniref:hypothetical protein n=1 Tax=Streptomyces sp. NPDC006172 TaxID=3154470 RepID=UPI0033FD53F6